MDSKAQQNKISVQELIVRYQAKVVTTETPDYLNLGWEGFGKEICFKLLSKEADGCGKAHAFWEIVPYTVVVGPSKDKL